MSTWLVFTLLASLTERAQSAVLHDVQSTFLHSQHVLRIPPQLEAAAESADKALYPTRFSQNILDAQYLFVGGFLLFFIVAQWSSSRKARQEKDLLAAGSNTTAAQEFFAKTGDRNLIHTVSCEETAGTMDSRIDGLTGGGSVGVSLEEVARRFEIFGANVLTPPVRENKFVMLLKQVFGGMFNIMLWACVVAEIALYVWMGGDDIVTPTVLSLVITSSGLLQWWTELKAEAMMESLQVMSNSPKVKVIRDGQDQWVDAAELVPGDVIALEAGDKLPAGVRVIKCTEGAEVDNSALTGESVPEPRHTRPEGAAVPQLEAHNMAFLGTTMLKGRVTAMVIFTGDETALGGIAASINACRPRSSLEMQIEHFVHIIAMVAMGVGLLSCAANCMSPMKRSWARILENSATAFFAQVPEGLLPTVTISLMIAAGKMTKRQVLVRKIDAVETLGCVSILCSDKTGTLTTGSMALTDLVPLPNFERTVTSQSKRLLIQCGILNNNANGNDGSPTEVAILKGCAKMMEEETGRAVDVPTLRQKHRMVFEIPFNSENKWALSIHTIPGTEDGDECEYRFVLKGAPEKVYPFCQGDSHVADLACSDLMRCGRRVLGFGSKTAKLPKDFEFTGAEVEDVNFAFSGFNFVGIVGLEDPPKPGVKEAIEAIIRAGVRPVMVTGDHPTTATAIAARIAIADETMEIENCCITGPVMSSMLPVGDEFDDKVDPLSVQEFWRSVVHNARIFARVSPSHKRVIVQAYQHYGENIVAMTGDGVNDAPALKQAEVGVAMGIRGTEVAKEAADIVLLNDDLQSIVAGVEQGRLCSENLRKSILYTLCSKVPQVVPTFVELLGVPTAMTVAQVLLIDIGTDIWTAIAFAWQPAESNLMSEKPRHPKKERMVTPGVLAYSYCYIGVLQCLACFFVFFTAVPEMWSMFQRGDFKHYTDLSAEDIYQNNLGMTTYYWTLVLGQVGAAIATTTNRESIITYGLPNLMLNICIVFEIVFAALIIYWVPAEKVFKTEALGWHQILMGAVAFFLIFGLEEMRKFFMSRIEKQKKLDSAKLAAKQTSI